MRLANILQCGGIQCGAGNELGAVGVGEMVHAVGGSHVFLDALLDEVVQLDLLFGVLKVGCHGKQHVGHLTFGLNEVIVNYSLIKVGGDGGKVGDAVGAVAGAEENGLSGVEFIIHCLQTGGGFIGKEAHTAGH